MSKMKTGGALAALMMGSTALTATADIDRAGNNLSVLFEDGNYLELSFGFVDPHVPGGVLLGGPVPLSQSATSYTVKTFGYKQQINDQLSFALISDEPYGASIQYVDAPPIAPGMAEVNSHALTAVARYDMGNGFSFHGGGIRGEKLQGQIISTPGLLTAEGDYEIGGVIGASYERPDIALRVSLTYFSAIDHTLDGAHNFAPTDVTVTTPERLHLDFQTGGIAENTLLFGSAHYAAWSGISLDSGAGATNWVNFPPDDTVDFTLGVGRRLSDTLSASISIGYEEGGSTGTTLLAPPAGTRKSIGLGVAYQATENVKISGGVRYIDFSDKVVTTAATGPVSFTGGSAIAAGVKVGISF